MKKALCIMAVAVAGLIPIVTGCAAENADGPTMTEAVGSTTVNMEIPFYDPAPGGEATTTASDTTRDERGGGSYGSGH